MLQLRQLHLQLALVGAGALGKNIQNQAGAIQHPALQLCSRLRSWLGLRA